jgi:Ulp1 family protease
MRTRSRLPTNGQTRPKDNANPVLFEYPPDRSGAESDRNVIIFTRHDYKHIQPHQFLNDTIISFFMQFHLDKHVDQNLKERIHIFNSFFFAKIKSIRHSKDDKDTSFAHASRWIKSVNIFDKEFLIMPVCENDHWILIIVCYPANIPQRDYNKIPDEELYEPAVLVLNSCNGLAPSIKKSLGQFLTFQWFRERTTTRKFSINHARKSGIRLIFPELPQQKNNYDCGVYILGFFYSFLKDPRKAYIKMFRKQSLKTWLVDNKIDISRERRNMRSVLDSQIAAWRTAQTNKTQNGIGSHEIRIGSPTSDSSIDDTMDDVIDTNGSVIVIH